MITTSVCSQLFIDGPNIDANLGMHVLGHKPGPAERPRWERFLAVARLRLGVKEPYFVLNGDRFCDRVAPFYRALKSIGFRVSVPRSDEGVGALHDPVDCYILERLVVCRDAVSAGGLSGVVLVSHDGGYAPALQHILTAGGAVYIVGFREWIAPELIALRARGARILDLERNFDCFDCRLDRPLIAA